MRLRDVAILRVAHAELIRSGELLLGARPSVAYEAAHADACRALDACERAGMTTAELDEIVREATSNVAVRSSRAANRPTDPLHPS